MKINPHISPTFSKVLSKSEMFLRFPKVKKYASLKKKKRKKTLTKAQGSSAFHIPAFSSLLLLGFTPSVSLRTETDVGCSPCPREYLTETSHVCSWTDGSSTSPAPSLWRSATPFV